MLHSNLGENLGGKGMKRNKNWAWQQDSFINGCNSVTLKSWQVLPDFLIKHAYAYPKYIFRGHSRASFALESPLARAIKHVPNPDKSKYLQNFKLAVRGRLNVIHNRLISDKELWVLGHNHGLKTPLLAWTQAAYIAAFFAFYNKRKLLLEPEATPKDLKNAKDYNDEPRTIYILNRYLVEEKRKKYRLEFVRKAYPKVYEKLKQLAGNVVSFKDPFYLDNYIDRILAQGTNVTYSTKLLSACESATVNRDYFMAEIIQPTMIENARLISQACLFTMYPLGITLEEWVQEQYAGVEDEILIKVDIPDDQRVQCLRTLHQMNITNLTLFPDIDGSARYCNDLLSGLY